ncbi:MAG TPA: TetR/AcrR family transcriptional regulator [Bradyrhizobium sp.]|nr:TetR/AcrR family transcriptional regulator [Bradyrhizobium sp.]
MARPAKPKPIRKPRADGQRNRDHLLDVAKAVFTREGTAINLDEVAKQAGLGVGTLYRHFPTRDALIEAVYRAEVEGLAAAAPRLALAHPPLEALRQWMRLFVDYIATKNLIAPALNATVGGPSEWYATSGELVKTAIRTLVGRAVEAGDIRDDIDPIDLLRALVGVANVAASPDWEASAKRLVDILLLGSKPSG